MEKVYVVTVDRYDCFKGHSWTESYRFRTIKEAWDCLKKEKEYDFRYDDAYHITYDKIYSYWKNDIVKTGRSGHRKYPWKKRPLTRKRKRDPERLEWIRQILDFSNDIDPDDEEIII